ncbi:MAG: hypothetical protein KKH74_08985 [Gammaproteobacteria bacterium]|nr:hypothetical protein [Gammaproteobacteria bacterium]MBU1732644.1 hypothetical protein [Gammaproteobacteria bacterium]MBU1893507.1 hypothetical protein [Gammaproteobacteria bacterium]
MGILSQVFAAVADVAITGAGVLFRAAKKIVDAAVPRIQAAIAAAKDTWNQARAQRSDADIGGELQEINDHLEKLKRQYERTGKFDHDLVERLKARRRELKGELRESDEFTAASDIAENEAEYDSFVIDDDRTHIIEAAMGQTVYNKPCPICSGPMRLQWKGGLSVTSTSDLGWGCTRWYWKKNGAHVCNHWEKLHPDDFQIFAKANRPEFTELTASQFSGMVLAHQPEVIDRMEIVRKDNQINSVTAYRCPGHGESLVLRKKIKHDGTLLDMYYLRCPRWDGDMGCQYMVKLKSPAQLHAFLNASTGKGVF